MKLRTVLNKKESVINKSVSEIISEISIERKEAEIIAAYLLKKNREFILAHPDTKVSPSLYEKIKVLEKKRLKNYPLAYLIGQKEFYGLNFEVNKYVLVPRPETEIMVENIINILKHNSNNKKKTELINRPLVIDIGTGSGAIIVSIAFELQGLFLNDLKNVEFKAVDISTAALKIAKNNAQYYKLNKTIKFYRGNLLAPLKKLLRGRDLIISANLPYLTPKQVKKSPSISREPKLALVAGDDGLKYYRELFKQLENIKYKSLTLFCEIDPSQSESISALAKDSFAQAKFDIIKDLAGLNRFLRVGSYK